MLAWRLLGSFPGSPTPGFPSDWNVTKFAGNPVINVDDNPSETAEQYVPAAFRASNGDIWVYVKGTSVIYAWKSTDDGETFTLENGGVPVLAPVFATWENSFVVEPHVIYDEASGVIHLWYKARDLNPNNWAWGHATALDSDPTDFTRDPTNPILTAPTVEADLGGTNITDLAISSVVVIGSTYHFYGYAELDGLYKLIHATGTTWNDPANVESLLDASSGSNVVETPSVVRIPGLNEMYAMFYTEGLTGGGGARSIYVASSSDGETWDFSDTTPVIAPGSGWESVQAYSGQFLRVNTSPYALPYIDGMGRWLYYYSGSAGGDDNSGLAYLEP